MLQDELVLTYVVMSPSGGCLWLQFVSNSPMLPLGGKSRPAVWGNDGLVANVATSWQLLFAAGWASKSSIFAHAVRKATSSHHLALFWNVWVYVWTCIYTCAHNSKKMFPWVPALHCALQLPTLVADAPFPEVLLDQALACLPSAV